MLEAEKVVKAVWQRLSADAALVTALGGPGRIWRDLAPQGTLFDRWLTFTVMSSVDTRTLSGRRFWVKVDVLVKIHGRWSTPDVSTTVLVPAAERVDALIDGYRVVVDGVQIVRFGRERAPYEPPEVVGGVQTRALNQMYATEAYQLPP